MLFAYRHALAVLFALMILAVGYVFDLRHLQETNNELMANENALRQPVSTAELKSVRQQKNGIKRSNIDNLQEAFVTLVAASQLNVQSILRVSAPPNAPLNDEYYQIVLLSDFSGLSRLLSKLVTAPHFVLRSIAVQTKNHGQLQTDMVIRASKQRINQQIIRLSLAKNPFCDNVTDVFPRQENMDEWRAFGLSQLTLVGTLIIQGKTSAIISFPNGVIKEVFIHSKLGKEQGIVEEITRNTVKLNLPSHQIYQLNTD